MADNYILRELCRYNFVDSLPKNPSGKILKRDIREEYIENGG